MYAPHMLRTLTHEALQHGGGLFAHKGARLLAVRLAPGGWQEHLVHLAAKRKHDLHWHADQCAAVSSGLSTQAAAGSKHCAARRATHLAAEAVHIPQHALEGHTERVWLSTLQGGKRAWRWTVGTAWSGAWGRPPLPPLPTSFAAAAAVQQAASAASLAAGSAVQECAIMAERPCSPAGAALLTSWRGQAGAAAGDRGGLREPRDARTLENRWRERLLLNAGVGGKLEALGWPMRADPQRQRQRQRQRRRRPPN